MSKLTQEIVRDLKQNIDLKYKKANEWFFKEGIKLYGVRIPDVRVIANQHYKSLRQSSMRDLFQETEGLMKLEMQETFVIATHWIMKRENELSERDFARFERWLKKYVDNWAKCDNLCTGPIGALILKYPKLVKKTLSWRNSRNRWVRRGAAVSLIKAVRHGKLFRESLSVSDKLLLDEDDMVQKGYGWLLKDASLLFSNEVYQFVLKRKDKMPRVSLRYAIERYSKAKKARVMSHN